MGDCRDLCIGEEAINYLLSPGLDIERDKSFQVSCLGYTTRVALVSGHRVVVGVTGVHFTAWLSTKLHFHQFVVYYNLPSVTGCSAM